MINETVILLTYNYEPDCSSHKLLKYVAKNYLGVYLPFDIYLYEPLRKMFAKVVLYDYLKRMTEVGIRAVNEEILSLVKKERPKYVLWTSWQYDVQTSTFDAIRSQGAKIVGWFFDDDWRFDDYSRWWIPHLDYCVTNALSAVPKYRELGARVIHTTPNTGVAIKRDWDKVVDKCDVTFVGSRNCADRGKFIAGLERSGIPVLVFGDGFGGYVSFERMIDIFQTSRINLNFSKAAIGNKEILQIKGRVFQVCLAGGFMLTEYAPGLEKYFEIGREIVCFKTAEEMADKIKYFLEHENERHAIARAGWEKAVYNYTSSLMTARVFEEIERDLLLGDNRHRGIPNNNIKQTPMYIRWNSSEYHFEWARALMEQNCGEHLWRDELRLALSLNPFNIGARCYQAIGTLPLSARPAPLRIFAGSEKLILALRAKLGSVSFIARVKHCLVDMMFYRRVRVTPR